MVESLCVLGENLCVLCVKIFKHKGYKELHKELKGFWGQPFNEDYFNDFVRESQVVKSHH